MKITFILKSIIGAFFIFLSYGSFETEVINFKEYSNEDFSDLIKTEGHSSVLYFNQTFQKNSKKNLYGGVTESYKIYNIELEVHPNGTFIYNNNLRQPVKGKWNIVQSNSIPYGCTGNESKCLLNLKFENGQERNPILYYDKKGGYFALIDCAIDGISDWEAVDRGIMIIPFDMFYN